MIDFQNVSKSFGARDIFSNASFRVEKGERVGIVGPNGSGKSTLFSLICGEMSADKGEIVIPAKNSSGSNTIHVFNADATLKSQISMINCHYYNSVGLAKVQWQEGVFKSIIVVFGNDKRLHAYDAQGSHLWQ